jgi:catechol 2,3-dioxygenase-like lactoylglutathione lyase family enzyme
MVVPFLVNLVVSDLARSVAFYRALGLEMSDPTGPHAVASTPHGLRLELDEVPFAALWDAGSPGAVGGGAVLSLAVDRRDEVDAIWSRMTAAGAVSSQRPYDAFWGARFAVLLDPDGHRIGLMSPEDDRHRSWPPAPSPR